MMLYMMGGWMPRSKGEQGQQNRQRFEVGQTYLCSMHWRHNSHSAVHATSLHEIIGELVQRLYLVGSFCSPFYCQRSPTQSNSYTKHHHHIFEYCVYHRFLLLIITIFTKQFLDFCFEHDLYIIIWSDSPLSLSASNIIIVINRIIFYRAVP